jgi:hypothetical protein
MAERKVHIENLRIRIPRGSVGQARAIAEGLGKAALRGVAESTVGQRGVKRIGEIAIGKVTVAGGAGIQGVQQQIAGRLAAALRKKVE